MQFNERFEKLMCQYKDLITKKNEVDGLGNGVINRYQYPVLTNKHTPLFWKYDLDEEDNPYLLERMGINCVFNSGAIELDGRILLVTRVEGSDRKSFFAVAESENGIDNFKFWDYPVLMPEWEQGETNIYDMRITKHEDGWMYGLFCVEKKDPKAVPGDTSSAIAKCGIARTKDLIIWERLKDLESKNQQRNVLLHPEFVDGKYALYTRPSKGFTEVGSSGGIGYALVESMNDATLIEERIIDERIYHTIKEVKNGAGAVPIKTPEGWLHIAHGVRNTAAGLRYVLYCFMTSLEEPEKVIYAPGGFFMAPEGEERIGDVSNVLFCNGAVCRDNKEIFIYYASSDTRLHVATTTVEIMIDYCKNTPKDGLCSYQSVQQRMSLIDKNLLKNSTLEIL